jgi:hypothetical protein
LGTSNGYIYAYDWNPKIENVSDEKFISGEWKVGRTSLNKI